MPWTDWPSSLDFRARSVTWTLRHCAAKLTATNATVKRRGRFRGSLESGPIVVRVEERPQPNGAYCFLLFNFSNSQSLGLKRLEEVRVFSTRSGRACRASVMTADPKQPKFT